jgi:hypothetical protein
MRWMTTMKAGISLVGTVGAGFVHEYGPASTTTPLLLPLVDPLPLPEAELPTIPLLDPLVLLDPTPLPDPMPLLVDTTPLLESTSSLEPPLLPEPTVPSFPPHPSLNEARAAQGTKKATKMKRRNIRALFQRR